MVVETLQKCPKGGQFNIQDLPIVGAHRNTSATQWPASDARMPSGVLKNHLWPNGSSSLQTLP